jgi:Mn2+/Fe2+ NRAMP family transporter
LEEGFDKKFHEARAFYIVMILSLVIGLLINIMGISPMKALFFTAVLYGITSPVMIAVVLHIGNNKKIMKEFTNTRLSNILGVVTLILMTLSAVLLIYFQFK